MDKKILFLRASSGWKDPSPPMAFAYLGRIAKDNGFKVIIENLNALYCQKTTKGVIALIKKENPMIVGVSIFTNYSQSSYKLIAAIRNYCKTIIAGGPHVTIYPEEALEKGADISIVGEAEGMFADLINAIADNSSLAKVGGIVYKENGTIKKTPAPKPVDIDRIPIPDKEIFKKSEYVRVKEDINNFGGILSSRGCPGRCTYCYHSLFGRCFRYRSAKNVFQEAVGLHREFGVTHINFIDDAFTINRKRLEELCSLFIESKLPIEWVCATRIDFLDEEIIKIMKKAGCVMISLGIESCIPSTLIKIKKTCNPEWYINHSFNVLKWCKEADIRAGVNILTGFPWDTAEDIKNLQDYVKKIKEYVTQSFCGGILQPMPNTEIYNECAKKYGFEKWWLYKEPLFKEDYHPFFMMYYHMFWEQLQNNFFKLDKKIFKEIDKLYKMMGKWNLWIITARRFKNQMARYCVYFGLLCASRISLAFYYLSPKIEKFLMEPLQSFSYKFKFKK